MNEELREISEGRGIKECINRNSIVILLCIFAVAASLSGFWLISELWSLYLR